MSFFGGNQGQPQGQPLGGQGLFGGNAPGTGVGGFQNNQVQTPPYAGQQPQNMGGSQGNNYKMEQNECEVQHPFQDSISDIKMKTVGQNQVFMAVSGWDGQIVVFQVNGQQSPPIVQPATQPQKAKCPILGICWSGDQQQNVVFLACSDGTIQRWDIQQQNIETVGKHDQAVKDVYSFQTNGQTFLISGGWDCYVKFWQVQGNQLQQIGQSWVGKPIHLMSGSFPLLVTAHSERMIHIWNLNLMFNAQFDPIHVAESPLKYATSAIACFADGAGYAVGSIEGRCGIVNTDFKNITLLDAKDFCFKCHRVEDSNKKDGDCHTVNHITFNKQHNTFATAGSDGTYIIWNKDTKSRYKQGSKSDLPINMACFSEDASLLAFASCEDWSLGADSASQRQNVIKFYVRRTAQDDVWKQKK